MKLKSSLFYATFVLIYSSSTQNNPYRFYCAKYVT